MKKNVLYLTHEKILFALIRCEKNCMFKLGVKKISLVTKKKNHSLPPPGIKWSAPNSVHYFSGALFLAFT